MHKKSGKKEEDNSSIRDTAGLTAERDREELHDITLTVTKTRWTSLCTWPKAGKVWNGYSIFHAEIKNGLSLKKDPEGQGDLKQSGSCKGKGELPNYCGTATATHLKLFSINHEIHFDLAQKIYTALLYHITCYGHILELLQMGLSSVNPGLTESLIIQLLCCLLLLLFTLMKRHSLPWETQGLIVSDTTRREQENKALRGKYTHFSFHPYLRGFSEPEIQFYTQQHWDHEGCPGMGYLSCQFDWQPLSGSHYPFRLYHLSETFFSLLHPLESNEERASLKEELASKVSVQ